MKQQCEKCGIIVSNMRRHIERERCSMQHIKKADRQIMQNASSIGKAGGRPSKQKKRVRRNKR